MSETFSITQTTEVEHFHTIADPETQQKQKKPIRPFDLKNCLSIYKSTFPSHEDDYAYRLNMYGLPSHNEATEEMSKEEATFWMHALTNEAIFTKWREDEEVFETLLKIDFNVILDAEGVKACFDNLKMHLSTHYYGYYSFAFLAWPIRRLLGFREGLLFLLDALSMDYLGYFLDVFGTTPDEDDDDMATIVGNFASQIDMNAGIHNWYFAESMMNLLMCGPDQEQIIRFSDAFIAAKRHDYADKRNKLVALIEDDELYKTYLKSMNIRFYEADIRLFLERLGFDELPYLLKLLRNRKNKGHLASLAPTLCQIHSRHMVEALLDMAEVKDTHEFADRYLMQEGANAMAGLLDQAARRGKKRDQAVAYLRKHLEEGNRSLVETHLEDRPKRLKDVVTKEVLDFEVETVDALVEDDKLAWMTTLEAIAPDEALEEPFDVSGAPPLLLVCQEKQVTPEIIQGMLVACRLKHRQKRRSDDKNIKIPRAKKRAERQACATLADMRQGLDPLSAGQWAWHLFSAWVVNGAQDTHDWITYLLGYLGTPVEAVKLETYVRSYNKWFSYYGEEQAKVVMDALKLMDSPAAWVLLKDLSVKQRSAKLQRYAQKLIDQIMKEKHWDTQTFDDMSIPTCGLDERGTRTFDYGTRTFDLTIHSANTFGVVDSEGTVFQKIPPRRKTDDKEKVASSKAVYKAMTKQIKQVFDVQKHRMEGALAMGRVWDVDVWRERMLEHPLMRHLARTVVWRVRDEQGQMLGAMLPTEDNSCLNHDYEPFVLPKTGQVDIYHPLLMNTDEREVWSDVLADFDIIQPFDQIGRAIYTHQDADEDFINESLMNLYSLWYAESRKACERAGWPVGKDRYAITRHFEQANTKAIMTFDTAYWSHTDLGDVISGDKRRVLFFQDDVPPSKESLIKATDVDSVVYSEVMLSVHRIVENFSGLY